MAMTKDKVLDKIELGIRKAHRKLIEERAANNDTVVVSVNGTPQNVPAKDILERVYKKKISR